MSSSKKIGKLKRELYRIVEDLDYSEVPELLNAARKEFPKLNNLRGKSIIQLYDEYSDFTKIAIDWFEEWFGDELE